LEGYSESLDHEVRQFGIHVSIIEPGFTRTNIAQNSQIASRPLEVYANGRNRVVEAVSQNIATGGTPLAVANVVLDALTSQSPRSRYPVGREVKFVSRLRKFGPTKLFEWGLRKQFRLDAA
jgi:short-subunit dehydrogenase